MATVGVPGKLRWRAVLSGALAAVLVVGLGGARVATAAGGWERIEPAGRTACARGGEFAFWARRADPGRLLVFFQGGGGCFSQQTCAVGAGWFDDAVGGEDDPAFAGGVLALGRADNPFRDYSIVFIPSCTGDVHVGDSVHTYRDGAASVTVRHRGYANAEAALRWADAQFPQAQTVFVTGCSAGSAGAAFHVPSVIRRYPKARVTYLGDSLAFVFGRPVDLERDWHAGRHLARWIPAVRRIDPHRFTMTAYLTAVSRAYPKRRFARFNFASDAVQARYYAAVRGSAAGFERDLRRAEETLKGTASNYRSYLACGAQHCVLPWDGFYRTTQAGVSVRDWVADLERGRDVSCPRCPS